MVGQLTGNRFHPRLVWIGGAAGEVDATCFQLHDKEQIESGQAALGPDLHGGEVNRSHHVPVRFQKRVPRPCPLANQCRVNAVLFQDVANGGVADVVSNIGQRALDPVITQVGFSQAN